jgi:Tol biopolymer transport system component
MLEKSMRLGFTALLVGLVAAVGLVVFLYAQPADAAFLGQNGRLVFASGMNSGPGVNNPEGDTEIFTMNPDGTRLVQLTHNSAYDYDPAWSADGKKIAFSSNRAPNPVGSNDTEVYVMRADGTNQRRVTDSLGNNWNPAWSPSGRKIAFQSSRHVTEEDYLNTEIYVVRVDGTGERRLTDNTTSDLMPDWSPNGKKIAFYRYIDAERDSDIFVMYSDGTNQRRVIDTPGYDYDPDWAPDGTKITFQTGYQALYKVRADGTGLTNLTNNPSVRWDDVGDPSWSPNGKKIAFSGGRVVGYDPRVGEPIIEEGIYLINPDGSGLKMIPGTSGSSGLDWQAR